MLDSALNPMTLVPSLVAPIEVLIVDDDPDFLDLLIAHIGRIPHVQITAAHDPGEALERLRDPKYRLVISDWALRGSTGGDVLAEADHRRDQAMDPVAPADRVPVLFISGSEKINETHRLHALHHFEAVSFVSKRCGPPLIGRVAEHILDRFVTETSHV